MFPYDNLPTVPDLSDQLEHGRLIGRGGFGSVYKGRWLGAAASATPAAVAIKVIEIIPSADEARQTKQFKQIRRELSLWYSIKHENILPLFGITRINGDANIPAFVSPWMENGNAKEFCSRNPHFPRMLILYDIINGLHYLHTSKPEIVHGDIKAASIIKGTRIVSANSASSSRFLTDNTLWKTTATHAGGTIRWMAPELINEDAPTPTKESDIYAYAMTCYEILSGDVPFKLVSNDMAIPLKVTKGQRPDRTESFYSDSMWDIITQCWEQDPEDRIPTEMMLGLFEKEEIEEFVEKFVRNVGTEKSLVIGIDVGMTLSSISYALLGPGMVPLIRSVKRFHVEICDSKVPSVVCYDQDGHVIAVGSETNHEVNPILSEIEGVRRAELFKLRLRPPFPGADKGLQLEEIFDDFKTVVQVYADFLQYLFKTAKEYIIQTEGYMDPTFTWLSVERKVYFVLTHPNGWERRERSQMREAAVAARLVDRSTAANRITFVTEGEANLRFCLHKHPEIPQQLGGLSVVDCGSGTIDLSAYSKTEEGNYKEIVSPDCLLQGSNFVTANARHYFKERFQDSQFGSDDYVEAMVRAFDDPNGAKWTFHDSNTAYFVKFGVLRDNDRRYDISHGRLKLEGAQVADFFEPAVRDTICGIENQRRNTKYGASIKYVLLVGSFARSNYLYERLRDYFKRYYIVVFRPDIDYLNETVVANGAVAYFVDRMALAQKAISKTA